MKKRGFIALALVVAIALVGAGYAAWTDTLFINTTVKTGNLDMSFEDKGEAIELKLGEMVTGVVDYAQDEENNGGNNWDIANVTLQNLYPGAKADLNLKMVNTGSIPVEMERITDERSSNWAGSFEGIGATVRFYNPDNTLITTANTTTYANPWEPAHLVNVKLPVGGYAIISFNFTAGSNIAEDGTYTFNVTSVWKQFTPATF